MFLFSLLFIDCVLNYICGNRMVDAMHRYSCDPFLSLNEPMYIAPLKPHQHLCKRIESPFFAFVFSAVFVCHLNACSNSIVVSMNSKTKRKTEEKNTYRVAIKNKKRHIEGHFISRPIRSRMIFIKIQLFYRICMHHFLFH